MKAVIVGAGIGGLAAGLALSRVGWDVEVLEQASEIAEVGAGLQLSPNGVRVLEELGVMARLEPVVFEPESISMVMGSTGRKIFDIPMKGYAQARWGARFLQVHRADLHGALMNALEEHAGLVVRLDTKATGYSRLSCGRAVVELEPGERIIGDIVIGADGINSVICKKMFGLGAPRFSGHVAWRAVVPVERLGDDAPPPHARIWAGAGKHAVTTWLRAGSMVNFVGLVEQEAWVKESWSITGDHADALREFGHWHPSLMAIIENAEFLHRWGLFERTSLTNWSDGPVTLLGDAAHQMLPSMAQGAVQALEDASVLAQCLAAEADMSRAVERYETLRKPRVTRIQQRSARNLALFHRSGVARQLTAYGPIWAAAHLSANLIHARQDWIYGYDATKALS